MGMAGIIELTILTLKLLFDKENQSLKWLVLLQGTADEFTYN